MQLGLQVKISSQLKLIRPIMSLGESGVTTACIGGRSAQTAVRVRSFGPYELFSTNQRGDQV